ncbi:type II secretion system F family protein [Sinomonas sp. ASV322]|uniref:type II secretion system F family protein n=1 Tax=Sinomonas sp. ASV322 TaxID=3041920 RepID=UPI0027DEAA96|nr:type II secretion system F family protein [Sinomonas sp. ASV322]MDQ4503790.1 type II secretion system F family protein [Sinomonas sp. ASV322]
MTAFGAIVVGAAAFGAWWLVWGSAAGKLPAGWARTERDGRALSIGRRFGGDPRCAGFRGGWFGRGWFGRGSRGGGGGPTVNDDADAGGVLRSALVLELVAAMLDAGSSLPRALGIAARVAGLGDGAVGRAAAALELGVSWEHAWPPDEIGDEVSEIRASLQFAAATGAPSAQLISARARLLRRARHRELERRAAALGVRLVVPLGTCSLPAFLCLGVVPVLISMMPG